MHLGFTKVPNGNVFCYIATLKCDFCGEEWYGGDMYADTWPEHQPEPWTQPPTFRPTKAQREAIEGKYHICSNCALRATAYYFPEFDQETQKRFLRDAIPRGLRVEIFERDGYKCRYCGVTEHLSIDHVIPISKGGRTNKQNLVTACMPCNLKKHDRTPSEAGMKLGEPTN